MVTHRETRMEYSSGYMAGNKTGAILRYKARPYEERVRKVGCGFESRPLPQGGIER